MFEAFGTVTHAIVMQDLVTGQSRGYGFVHFTDATAAAGAKDGMNGKQIDGRSLIVRLRSETPGSGGGPKPGLGHISAPTAPGVVDESKLYVCYLDKSMMEDQVKAMFSSYAPVLEVKVIMDRATGQSKGYAFVTMASAEGAQVLEIEDWKIALLSLSQVARVG
jgi:nucleolin